MAEVSGPLPRRSPLAGRLPEGTVGGVRLRPVADAARFIVRIRATDQTGVGTIAGFDLSGPINRWSGTADRLAARLGPDEWLLIAPEAEAKAIQHGLASGLSGRRHAVFDQSHRLAGFTIEGQPADRVINANCPLDLDARTFPVGMGTRSIFAKAEIILLKLDAAPLYRVEAVRSFAAYVAALMSEAAAAE